MHAGLYIYTLIFIQDYISMEVITTCSLRVLCLNQAVDALETYSPQLLSRIPPALRYQLFLQSPIVDICTLDKTRAFDDVDVNKLWAELYEKHWSLYDLWNADATITSKVMESISGKNITSREKYFILLTTVLFSGERPSGYFQWLEGGHRGNMRNNSVPEVAMKHYPTDIVNYLVAANISSVVSKKVTKSTSASQDHQDGDQDSDQDSDNEADFYDVDAENCFPTPQRELDDSVDDGKLSCNYGRVATKNQRIPQRHTSLVESGCRLPDEVAISLMMKRCNYFPTRIALCVPEEVNWSWNQDDLRQLHASFFGDVKEVHLCISDEPGDRINSNCLSTCHSNSNISSLQLHILCELVQLDFSLLIPHLSLEKLNIIPSFDLEDSASEGIATLLSHQQNLHELEFEMNECSFPNETPKLLTEVLAAVQNPNFCKFCFSGIDISVAVFADILLAFLSNKTLHPQELYIESYTVIEYDDILRKKQSYIPFAVRELDVQQKSLTLMRCSGKICSWVLSLKPLLLESMKISYFCDTVEESHNVLKGAAENDQLQVNDITLIEISRNDVRAPLSEEVVSVILKRPLLKSLTLDLKCKASDVMVMTNALSTQIQLGTLEKLCITFHKLETPEQLCDIELLIETIFNLPQITRFSFHVDMHLDDLQFVKILHKYWHSKKPKELCFGHFPVALPVPDDIQSLVDEMELIMKRDCNDLYVRSCCHDINYQCPVEFLKLCTSNL